MLSGERRRVVWVYLSLHSVYKRPAGSVSAVYKRNVHQRGRRRGDFHVPLPSKLLFWLRSYYHCHVLNRKQRLGVQQRLWRLRRTARVC